MKRTDGCYFRELDVYLKKFQIRRFAFICFTLGMFALINISSTNAATIINGGTVNQHTTWNTDGSPYILTASVYVAQGVGLTIDPGVIVEMDANVSLTINGFFDAVGSLANPIIFRWSVEGSHWGGIRFNSPDCDLSYCKLIGGGIRSNFDATISHNIISRWKMPENTAGQGCCTVIFQIAFEGIWQNEKRNLKDYGTSLHKFI